MAKYIPSVFVFIFMVVVVVIQWNDQKVFKLSENNPLFINLMEQPAYIRRGFVPEELLYTPAELYPIPKNFNDNGEWTLFETRPLKVMESPLPDLPKRPFLSPWGRADEEFTIIMLVQMDSTAISFLNNNPLVLPGIYFANIGDNWEVYFNGTLIRSEIHLNEYKQIKSHRFWRDVYFPFNKDLIVEGSNILAIRIIGDPAYSGTGFAAKIYHYIDDFRIIEKRQNNVFLLILCGVFGIIGIYHLVLFFSIRNRKEISNLYFAVFSILLCIYAFKRHSLANGIIPDSNIFNRLEYIILIFLMGALCMFIEAMGRGKITKITKGYLVFCTVFSIGHIFFCLQFGEDAMEIWEITILFYYTYVFLYSVIYFYFWNKKGLRGKNNNAASGASFINVFAGALLVFICGYSELLGMIFLETSYNLFIYSAYAFHIGMTFTMSNRFNAMYTSLETTLEERDYLLTQIKTLLSKAAVVPKSLAKGSLTLDIIAYRAFVDNQDLLLTPKEFAVLLLLTQYEGKTMSAETIYEIVWKLPLNDNINTLKKTISTLRKKIENSGYEIAVSRGKGYIFERI